MAPLRTHKSARRPSRPCRSSAGASGVGTRSPLRLSSCGSRDQLRAPAIGVRTGPFHRSEAAKPSPPVRAVVQPHLAARTTAELGTATGQDAWSWLIASQGTETAGRSSLWSRFVRSRLESARARPLASMAMPGVRLSGGSRRAMAEVALPPSRRRLRRAGREEPGIGDGHRGDVPRLVRRHRDGNPQEASRVLATAPEGSRYGNDHRAAARSVQAG